MNANARLVVDRWLDGTEAQVTWGDISSGGAAAIVWSGEYFGYPPRIETAPPLLLIGKFRRSSRGSEQLVPMEGSAGNQFESTAPLTIENIGHWKHGSRYLDVIQLLPEKDEVSRYWTPDRFVCREQSKPLRCKLKTHQVVNDPFVVVQKNFRNYARSGCCA